MLARLALLCVLGTAAAPPAVADEPPPLFPPDPSPPAADASATAVLTGVPDAAPCPEPSEERFDVIVGLPLAGRYQNRIGKSRFWGEVGAGLFLIVPDFFAGVRADIGIYEGKRNAVLVRPGVDAHVAVWPFGDLFSSRDNTVTAVPAVAADVDLVWRRAIRNKLHGEFGVKLGVITFFGDGHALPLPTAGLLCGVQF